MLIPESLIRCGISKDSILEAVGKKFGVSKENVQLEKCEPKNPTENVGYVGEIIILEVNVKILDKIENCSFVVKRISDDDFKADFAKSLNAFEKESHVYQKMVPQWQNDLAEAGLSKLKVPDCYNVDTRNNLILLDNLRTSFFQMPPKHLDNLLPDEMDMAITELAKFHAVTFHYIRQYPKSKFLTDHQGTFDFEGIYAQDDSGRSLFNDTMMCRFSAIGIQIYKDSHPALDAGLIQAMDEFCDGLYNQLKRTSGSSDTGFNVLAHNDFHMGNIMLKRDQNKLVDLRILDLQLLKLSRPTLDLAMLYANGTVPDFKRKHEKEWNQLYHRELAKNLTSFGYDPEKEYPFKQFQKDMEEFYVCYLNYSFVRTMWEFGPLDEWKSVDNLEAELKEWNSFFARAVANPSAKLKSMIANLVDDAILEGFFQS